MLALTFIAGCSAVIVVASTNHPLQVELSAGGEVIRSRSTSDSELLDLGAPALPKSLKTEFLKQDGDIDGDPRKATLVQRVTGSTPTGGIQVGTAFKDMRVIFDTGSDRFIAKTWDTISHMLSGVDDGIGDLIMPTTMLYNHNSSSTYKRVLIKSKDGTKDEQSYGKISYGSGDAITEEGTDTISIAQRTLMEFPVDEIVKDSLPMLHTSEAISGVFGLMHMKNYSAGESAFSRLWKAGEMTAFGFCHGRETADADPDSDGAALLDVAGKPARQSMLLWGDKSTEGDMVEVVGSSHWAVKMTNFAVTKSEHKVHDVTKDSNFMPILAQQGQVPMRSQPIFADGTQDDKDTGKIWPLDDWFGSDKIEPNPGTARDSNTIAADPETADRQFQDSGENVEDSEVSVCADEGCAAIIDTGSNIFAMSTAVVKQLSARLGVKHDCSNLGELDDITFNLGNALFKVSAASYVMKVKLPEYAQGDIGDIAGAESGAGGGEGSYAEGGKGGESGGYIDGGSAGGGEDTAAALKAMEDAISHWMSDKDSQGHRRHARADSAAEKSNGQVYRTRDPFHPFVNDRASLTQEAVSRRHRTGVRTGWPAALHQLATRTGIDLRHALPENFSEMLANGKIGDLDTVCMPALSPMDMTTKYGPLMVLGTPLFNEYYARFSRDSPNHVSTTDDKKVVDQASVVPTDGELKCGTEGKPCGEAKEIVTLIEDVTVPDSADPEPKIFFQSLAKCAACDAFAAEREEKANVGDASAVAADSKTIGKLKLSGDSETADSKKKTSDSVETSHVNKKLSADTKFLEETSRRQSRSKSSAMQPASAVQQKTRPIITPREMRLDEIRMLHPSRVGWEL